MKMNPIEQLIVQSLEPHQVPEKMAVLGLVLAKAEAGPASASLIAAIANMVGNIPDDKWAQMEKFEFPPCSNPGCSCHLVQKQMIQALKPVRDIFIKATENPDEQEMTE